MTNEVAAVTNETFEQEVVQSQKPVLVDFYADWCGPCKTLSPIVEEIAAEYEGRITVRKVDIDSNPELARQYGVRSIPTLMVFKDGEAKDTIIGAVPKSKLAEVINQHAA
jgi:thioredoxin 1